MRKERLYVISVIIAVLVLYQPADAKKVIIHVPYRVKNVKHTHTIYKVLPHHHHRHEEKKDKFVKEDQYVHEEESEEFDHFKKR